MYLYTVAMSKLPTTRAPHAGRPPSGPAGERVSDYPTLTVRLPRATKDALISLSALRRLPLWKMLDVAVRAYIDGLPAGERHVLVEFIKKMEPTHERQSN